VIDYEKSARIIMMDKATMQPAFDLVVYGVTPEDLMQIPNPTINSIARRFPEHQSSPFHIKSMRRPQAWPRAARPPRPFPGGSDE
jgi:hypothetical protein